MAATKIVTTPGWNSEGDATLTLAAWIPREEPLQFDVREIASYALRYDAETNEVMLVKGDEIVYSELLGEVS